MTNNKILMKDWVYILLYAKGKYHCWHLYSLHLIFPSPVPSFPLKNISIKPDVKEADLVVLADINKDASKASLFLRIPSCHIYLRNGKTPYGSYFLECICWPLFQTIDDNILFKCRSTKIIQTVGQK